MLNIVYFEQVVFIFKLYSCLYVRVVKLLFDLCSVAILVYNNNIAKINTSDLAGPGAHYTRLFMTELIHKT